MSSVPYGTESGYDPGDSDFEGYALSAFLTNRRKDWGVRSSGTKQWIRQSTSLRASHIPRKETGVRPALNREREALASRYFQFLTGHAITAPYLKDKLRKRDSDECWFCLSGKRQSRDHLFKECDRWLPQIRGLWRSVEKAGLEAPSVATSCRAVQGGKGHSRYWARN
ncbi:hypothetical protein FN846DRAFT_994051 [Sphaerosporella brunnea]|uniref:Uncharacterized protein n=1 Tax=Sphaerosporella brunnea TaxID=1250544 RepID=A0A5J5EMK6_9PEZI|nr:hypothetical protein FN846DRAFT_994051 [Sphaerosporella brunnea]